MRFLAHRLWRIALWPMSARSCEGFLYLVKASMPDPRFTASVLTGLPPRSVALSHLLADIRHLLLDVAWSRME